MVGCWPGPSPHPGEVSLAHNGVLFLDAIADFRRTTLQAVGDAIAHQSVALHRCGEHASFPARPLLVGATHPCPCGSRWCHCTDSARRSYVARVPLEMFDLRAVLDPAAASPTTPAAPSERSANMRARVVAARGFRFCRRNLPPEASTAERVARTIADLAGSVTVTDAHTAEAVSLTTRGMT